MFKFGPYISKNQVVVFWASYFSFKCLSETDGNFNVTRAVLKLRRCLDHAVYLMTDITIELLGLKQHTEWAMLSFIEKTAIYQGVYRGEIYLCNQDLR